MMTAEQARQQTNANTQDEFNSVMEEIEKEIGETVEKGNYMLNYKAKHVYCTNRIIVALEELGYAVEASDNWLTISWK